MLDIKQLRNKNNHHTLENLPESSAARSSNANNPDRLQQKWNNKNNPRYHKKYNEQSAINYNQNSEIRRSQIYSLVAIHGRQRTSHY
jgi:hypothetical protein